MLDEQPLALFLSHAVITCLAISGVVSHPKTSVHLDILKA